MLMRVLMMAIAIYAGLLLLLFLFQSRLVFLPHIGGRDLVVSPERIGLNFDEVTLNTADGERLHAWWLPHPEARATLLFAHGNAGNISHRLDSLQLFHDLGLNVLIFDYRGYGRSTGSPSEQGSYRDARTAWNWLVEERGVQEHEIIIFGRSMGGAVAANLAADVDPGGLIVESTFTSVPDIGAELYWWMPVRWLSRIHFPAIEFIAAVDAPVLIIHSPDDEIIPFSHARRLEEAAGESASLLEIRGDHNTGFLSAGTVYTDGLGRFLDQIERDPP